MLENKPIIQGPDVELLFPRIKTARSKGFFASDKQYNTTSINSMQKVLNTWKLYLTVSRLFKKMVYSQKFDCDNFSDTFMGFAKLFYPAQGIGTVWFSYMIGKKKLAHAINFFVVWNKNNGHDVFYVEPQTGMMYSMTEMMLKYDKMEMLYVRI